MKMDIVQAFEKQQMTALANSKIANFKPGDTVCVSVKIVEEANERVQAYEGLCIARRNRGLGSSITVRKVSDGEGVERTFPLYSPRIVSISVVKRGIVRRAKLYYIRKLSGKASRIKEVRFTKALNA